MEKIVLQAELRGVGRHQVRELRQVASVPAVVYGAHSQPQTVAVNARALSAALHAAGTGLVTLQIGAQTPVQVLTREVQRHPIKHNVLHVDFQAVSMTEKLRLDIPVIHEGVSPAMSLNHDLVLVRNLDMVAVECLPSDIPQHLVADISQLKKDSDEILVSDLPVPPGVKVLTAHDHVVISLTMSRAGALEEEAAPETPSADQVEVVTKGKAAKEGAEEAPEKPEKK